MVIELKNIHYNYRPGEPALCDISLEVPSGERVVILGPNGSGKSTLQKIIAGLIYPASGRFMAFGQEITQDSMRDNIFATAFRRKVGFVFQNSDVQLFCASVRDEVMFGPLTMGLPPQEARDRTRDLLEMFELAHLADRLPHHLSGGEKKKAALAAVLAVGPEVLILDEPTNGLDPRTQRWMIDILNQLASSGKTLLIATHHLDIVPELADRVVVMDNSHTIVAEGCPLEILENRDLLLAANLVDEGYHVHFHSENRRIHVHRHVPLG